jgi:hypothetical protein
MVLYTVALCLAISPWGIATTYLNERFPTGVRASGYGIGYSLATIIPSFFRTDCRVNVYSRDSR